MNEKHFIQMRIIKSLMFKPDIGFSELNTSGLSSDQFSYHLNSLIEEGLIQKNNQGLYSLTHKGRKFGINLDTDNSKIKMQPKVSALVIVTREKKEEKEILMMKRLKTPFYGFWGFFSGKVKYSEKIEDAAVREVKEESGLEISEINFRYILHELLFTTEGELLEDKIFFTYEATKTRGEVSNSQEGECAWLSEKEFYKQKKKFYDLEDLYNWIKNPPEKNFIEKIYKINRNDF